MFLQNYWVMSGREVEEVTAATADTRTTEFVEEVYSPERYVKDFARRCTESDAFLKKRNWFIEK